MSKKVHLLIVDPQNDFCIADDGHGNKGALVVPGAEEDMKRLAAMIDRCGSRIDDISATMDSHQTVGIERPRWWKRVSDGTHPSGITPIGIHPDCKRIVTYTPGGSSPNKFGMSPTDEEWTTYLPKFLHQHGPTGKGSWGYLEALAERGRYPHVVWTEHCPVGSWGWSLVESIRKALREWEWKEFGRVNFVVKGNNPWTEHFSGVQAEVPDPKDHHTQVNVELVKALEEADVVAVAGEALSHCVANTGVDIGANFSDPKYIEKMVLLTDATSNVGGFDFLGDAFIKNMVAKGMKLSTTKDFLA